MEILNIKKKVLVLDKDEIKKLKNILFAYIKASFCKSTTNHKFAKYMIVKLEEIEL